MKGTPLIILAASIALVALAPGKGKQPELILAVQAGNIERIETLIREGNPVDVINVEGTTPLMVACQEGKLEAAKLLLAKGAKLNYQSKCAPYHTPLFCAVLASRYEVVQHLLGRGADRSLRDSVEKTVLVRAKERKDAKMVALLEAAAQAPKNGNAAP